MKAAFEALIKEINNKALTTCDKMTWLKLEFESSDKLEELNALNELQIADQTVYVVIMSKDEARGRREMGND